jgi:hypothetical protein
MKGIRQFLFTDLFAIDKNRLGTWKTGAKIGLIYGITGWIYMGLGFLLQSTPTSLSHPTCDGCEDGYGLFGFFVFIPIFYIGFFLGALISLFFHINIFDFSVLCMPISGMFFGAFIGYCIERFNAIK